VPTREEIELRERAERALRIGRPGEALALFRTLLRRTTVFEAGLYESWLEGALSAYQALGRGREAGYVLLALRRFADAEQAFDAERTPVEWALAASRQGHRREAATVLANAGFSALAALELDAAGEAGAAAALWEKLLDDPRLYDRPYETALINYNLAEARRRQGDQPGARQASIRTQEMLEALADAFERRGQRERSFDCYGILLRLGRDTGSFENVSEGYLNAIRLLSADDQKFYVLQYYEDFLAYAIQAKEWHAAATLAREAADYCGRVGLLYERHYRQRAASLFSEAARHVLGQRGPPEMAENALVAAIDVAAGLGDLSLCGDLYAAAADLNLPAKRKDRYAALATRFRGKGERRAPGPSFPEYLRRTDAYQDVWRQDLVEWELDGRPIPVLTHIVVERVDHAPFSRAALRALLTCMDERGRLDEAGIASDLAHALGAVQVYEVLRPLEDLALHAEAGVRAAVMAAVSQVYCKRSFGVVRQGLVDSDEMVRTHALRALRALHFRDGLDPLSRIFREFSEEAVRLAALEAIADIGNLESGYFLLETVRREQGTIRDRAFARLRGIQIPELTAALRHAASIESGQVRRALEDLVRNSAAA